MSVITSEKIKLDPADEQCLLNLMDKYGNVDSMLDGKNEHGEDVFISIYPDNIVVRTHQENGWVRVNAYYKDGTRDETFDGKWK